MMDSKPFGITGEIKQEDLADEEMHSFNDQEDSQMSVNKSKNEQFCNYSQKLVFEIKMDQDEIPQEMDEIRDCEVKRDHEMMSVPAGHNYCQIIIRNDKEMCNIKQETKHTMENSDTVTTTTNNFSQKLHEENSSKEMSSPQAMGDPTRPIAVTPTVGGTELLERSSSSRRGHLIPKAGRSLPLEESSILLFLHDSGSDDDSASSEHSNADEEDLILRNPRSRLRQVKIEREKVEKKGNTREEFTDGYVVESDVVEDVGEEGDRMHRLLIDVEDKDLHEVLNANELRPNISTDFNWTDDFSSFSGQRETYRHDPGPRFCSQDPTEIFLKVWDEDVMELIAAETNTYARHYIEAYTDPDFNATIRNYLEQWREVTVPVLYQYFAMLICMSFCVRAKLQEYWDRGLMEMRLFQEIMNQTTFLLITKFLHFVSDRESTVRGYARKIGKVAPILNHCNKKFSELYIPAQHISLNDSLILGKGHLRWRKCKSAKATRFGIKSFDLCEAKTGYLLKYKLYTGRETPMHLGPQHGFSNKTARIVLDLMEGYLDVGHVLVMDNWYNQMFLTRYIKSRCTDVLGTINRSRRDVPQDLKDLKPNSIARGNCYARHCGDIALVAWKDVKLVTVLSTYHDHRMVQGRRAGVDVNKPVSVHEYNRCMGGILLKDQNPSTFPYEGKRCRKWYKKIFRRLISITLRNAFIIYTRNPMYRVFKYREFQRKVAEGLLARYGCVLSPLPVPTSSTQGLLRLRPGDHFPIPTEKLPNRQEHRKLYCVRCKVLKKRNQVRLMCSLCRVPLCLGQCWVDYHKYVNLSINYRGSGDG